MADSPRVGDAGVNPRTPRFTGLGPPQRTPSSAKAAPQARAHAHAPTPTPGRARKQAFPSSAQQPRHLHPPASASLRELANATEAEFWLRKANRAELAGDFRGAERILREAISRNAHPVGRIHDALHCLTYTSANSTEITKHETHESSRRALNFALKDGSTQTDAKEEPHHDAPEYTDHSSPNAAIKSTNNQDKTPEPAPKEQPCTEPETTAESDVAGAGNDENHGSQIVLTPVSAKRRQRDELCAEKVVTPVRRSARKRAGGEEGVALDLSGVLEQGSYSFSPNPALKGSNLQGGPTQAKNCAAVSDGAAECWTESESGNAEKEASETSEALPSEAQDPVVRQLETD